MPQLVVDNYIVTTPIIDILNRLKSELTNGKLRDIKVSATDIAVTCPNDGHAGGKEHSPDCHINLRESTQSLEYGYVHCFACGFAGPFYKFVAACFSKPDDFGKQWLIENYGTLAYEKVIVGDVIDINKGRRKKTRGLDKTILDTYQSWHPYLAKRKLSREICEMFNVKYDASTRSVVFPCYDTNGKLLMAPKRSIDTKIFYLNSAQDKPVYCLDFINKNNIKSAIITEGPIDCLTAYTYGFPAIATFGSISDEQIDKINNSCLETIYTMFDNDAAGYKFTAKLTRKLNKRILVTKVQLPANKKDINELTYYEFWESLKKSKETSKITLK